MTQGALTVRLLAAPCWFLEPYCLGLEVCHPIIPIDGRRYGNDRPFADSDRAARHIVEIANQIEPVQDRTHIEKINGPSSFDRTRSTALPSAVIILSCKSIS